MKINKKEFIDFLSKQATKTNQKYLIDKAKWKLTVIKELKKNIKDAEAGEELIAHSKLRAPVSKSNEYDRLISALKRTTDKSLVYIGIDTKQIRFDFE